MLLRPRIKHLDVQAREITHVPRDEIGRAQARFDLIGWPLDRLGRRLGNPMHPAHEFKARGVGFASPTEQIDTRSTTGQLVFHLFGALAEFERNLTRERTLAGLKASGARGRKGGRPRKLTDKDLKTVGALPKSGDIPVISVAGHFGVARSTLYRNACT